MSKSIPRGTVLMPMKQEVPANVNTRSQFISRHVGVDDAEAHRLHPLSYMASYGYSSGVIGIHVYLGKNEWLLPSGRVKKDQSFHRKILNELRLGWWKVVEA